MDINLQLISLIFNFIGLLLLVLLIPKISSKSDGGAATTDFNKIDRNDNLRNIGVIFGRVFLLVGVIIQVYIYYIN